MDQKQNIARALLEKDDGWHYNTLLPIKVRKGEWDWALPDILRQPMLSEMNVMDSIGTGQLQSPEGTEALLPDILSITPVMRGAGGLGRAAAPAMAAKAESTIADDIPFTEIEEVVPGMRMSAQEQALQAAKQSEYWPQWGDQYPERALAHVRDMQASAEWNALVQKIQAPDGGLSQMDRWQAEKLAMEQAPDVGRAMQDARLGWHEQDKGRALKPSELTWHDLDRPPGAEPLAAEDLTRAVLGRAYDTPRAAPAAIRSGQSPSPGARAIARALLEKK